VTARWTCSTTFPSGLLAAPTEPAPWERLRICPGWTWPPRATPRRCQSTARPLLPAGCRGRDRPHGVPPAARRDRQTGSAGNQGVATGSWGAAKSATTSIAGSGDQAEQSKLRNSPASAFMPSGIGPTRFGTQRARAPSNSGGYLGERRWRWPAPKISPTPVNVLPARGRVAPTRDPTRVRTLPISGSSKTPNSQRRSRMDRNMTRGYPTSHPPHPGHTPSATSAMPDPQSPSIAAPPSGGRRRQTSGGGRPRRAATPG